MSSSSTRRVLNTVAFPIYWGWCLRIQFTHFRLIPTSKESPPSLSVCQIRWNPWPTLTWKAAQALIDQSARLSIFYFQVLDANDLGYKIEYHDQPWRKKRPRPLSISLLGQALPCPQGRPGIWYDYSDKMSISLTPSAWLMAKNLTRGQGYDYSSSPPPSGFQLVTRNWLRESKGGLPPLKAEHDHPLNYRV